MNDLHLHLMILGLRWCNLLRQRRERPHLILDAASGHITHLINGVQPPPTAEKAPPSSAFQNDYTYTLIQPIQGH